MGTRSKIIELAELWAYPGEWKPSAGDLVDFFKYAGAEFLPTIQESQAALDYRVTGVKVNGEVKHWCGVFACYIIREIGLSTARWTLYGGKIKNIELVWGCNGIQPGDIAMIQSGNHHFIVTGVDSAAKTMRTVEGNTSGQYIRSRTRRTTEPYAYYRVPN